jgi:acyl-CoA thioester hydrolase
MSTNSIFHYEFTVVETHLDFMGHMNNATYLQVFEEARWEIVVHRGYDYKMIQKSKKGPVILDVKLRFSREVTLRERVRITTEFLSYRGKVGTLRQTMYKQDGTVAAEAEFTTGLFDMVERKLIEPTPEWKMAVGLAE